MTYTTLISVAELQALQASGQSVQVFDCSFDLMAPHVGLAQYLAAHVRGALHADLDQNLSARHGLTPEPGQASAAPAGLTCSDADKPASGGRHPLPNREKFAAWLSSIGFANDMQAVVYDRQGANYCGRLWWMLKWAGHANVAVLDGGWAAWQAAGGAEHSGAEPAHFSSNFVLQPALVTLVDAATVASQLGRPGQTLIDARGAPRFRGEVEPLDPVAGHIPGALNRPFGSNLTPEGFFKPAAQLRAEFEALLGQQSPSSVVHHCGSGVSALPNMVAMEWAGLGSTALYAGSWSDWCSDPSRPVAQG